MNPILRILPLLTLHAMVSVALSQPSDVVDPEPVNATGVRGGLCVVVPATSGQRLAELSCGGRFVVQGLTVGDSLPQVRQGIPARFAGLVSARNWSLASSLPYADNLLDLLVVDQDALRSSPGDAELLRVIVPQSGAVWRKHAGAWSKLTKPMPEQYGEWTHYYGNPSQNPVSSDRSIRPPTGIQWSADSPANIASDNQLVQGGLYLGNFHDDRRGQSWTVTRSAFNGLRRWQMDYPSRNGIIGRQGALVMVDGTVYTLRNPDKGPLVALDSATGRETLEFKFSVPPTEPAPRRHLHRGNLVIYKDMALLARADKLFCADRFSGALRWTFDGEGKNLAYPAIDLRNNRVGILIAPDASIYMDADRETSFRPAEIASIDLATGRAVWRVSNPVIAAAKADRFDAPSPMDFSAYLWSDGIFFFNRSKRLSPLGVDVGAIDAASGKTLWLKFNLTHWAGSTGHPGVGIGSLLAYPDALVLTRSALVAYDPRTGNSLGEWCLGNSRCDNGRGFADGFTNFGHFFHFTDKTSLAVERREIARNPCGGAALPAHGLVYYQPQICVCFAAVRGMIATGSQAVAPPTPDDARLEKGPAFNRPVGPAPASSDWPAFLSNSARAAAGSALKHKVPAERWRVRLETGEQPGEPAADWRACANYNGPISAPVVSNGLVIVAAPDAHHIYALDAATGQRRWTFTTAGRVDTPPTVAAGRVYAGCRDGYVYCLDLPSGDLAWRFLAARNEKQIAAFDQLESAWPVHGSLVVEKGVVVATAGYHPDADGGIHCWGLDAATGAIRWRRVVAAARDLVALDPATHTMPRNYFTPNRVVNSLPNSDGSVARIPGLTFDILTGEGKARLPGETPARKPIVEPPPAHRLMVYDWGFAEPWLRSMDGLYKGPGNNSQKQSITAEAGIPSPAQAWGRRVAWNDRYFVQILPFSTELIVLAPNPPRPAAIDLPRGVAVLGKPVASIALSGGGVHKMSPYGGPQIDPAAMLLADGLAVLAWAAKEPAHHRTKSFLQFVDLDSATLTKELVMEPGVIEHGMATAGGRLYLSLDDGSLVAME